MTSSKMGYNKTYDFRKFKAKRVFGNEIRHNIINMYMEENDKENDEKNHLRKYSKKFTTKTKPENHSNF